VEGREGAAHVLVVGRWIGEIRGHMGKDRGEFGAGHGTILAGMKTGPSIRKATALMPPSPEQARCDYHEAPAPRREPP
jgi:hypothetical protein